MKTPRRRDSGVSLGRFISFKNPPLPPFSKVGLAETPQQRLWGIENLNKNKILIIMASKLLLVCLKGAKNDDGSLYKSSLKHHCSHAVHKFYVRSLRGKNRERRERER
jgi:hypothetical protein